MFEKSACGVGFLVSRQGVASHEIVKRGLKALERVEHRGATASDGLTGDGAGLMTDIPFELLGFKAGEIAVATLFVSTAEREVRRQLLSIFEETFAFWGIKVLHYRKVPVDSSRLGQLALKSCPEILHAILERPSHCNTDASFDKALHVAKQMTLTRQRKVIAGPPFFFTSLSTNTIVYKALTTSAGLSEFYLDFKNPKFKSRFALFHRRFSTNTVSSWDKAQPFRMIAHNGEINTIAGNRSWGYSCEKSIGLPQGELISHDGISDSGSVNEMVEALIYRSGLPRIEDCLALMMPPAAMNGGENSFYKFWGRTMEPWDGPALMAFCNGETLGARLDRNGFRPCRWSLTKDMFYLASEAGTYDVPENEVLEKGALGAGRSVKVSLLSGAVDFRDPSERHGAAHFYSQLTKLPFSNPREKSEFDSQVKSSGHVDSLKVNPSAENLAEKFLFNVTDEEFSKILKPMMNEGKEPIGSMGDTARLAILSDEPRPFFDYFYQNFAQVTNPPLDYLREKMVTDLSVYLGARPNLFEKKELIPPPPALEIPSPLLSLGQLEVLEASTTVNVKTFDITYEGSLEGVSLQAKLDQISDDVVAATRAGVSVAVLSDKDASWERLPVPALLILRAIVRKLNEVGLRLKVSLVFDSGQIRTTHQVAATIAFGASAICPRVALKLARATGAILESEKRERHMIKALESGLLKVMSKMGISVVRSYQGSKLFTIIGLSNDLCRKYFRGVPSLLGGLDIHDVAAMLSRQAESAKLNFEASRLAHTHQLREHPQGLSGEKHSMTSSRARAIHKLVKEKDLSLKSMDTFDEFLKKNHDDHPVNVRHLLQLKKVANAPYAPVDIQGVEPVENILKRFGSGAMSFGAISAEAQRDIILAMAEIGGRSNSGEGGENPYYLTEGISASTKQIASARFGVTANYLIASNEFQIKMAQGAKPGEGGQLMAPKVNEDIARARHSMTHVDLISPPPMHDIYSIEDLKELIYELKQLKPDAKVGVKLVSGAHIGTIAVGVVKAGADIVQISGSDGGTGAAPISSMKHAGLPFEFGLLEVHKALVENDLRHQVILRADGGLQSGLDIVMAAMMGAQEFDFGKLLLIAEGCVMARVCEKNTCPAGIATHDPKFKARYTGNKDKIIQLLRHIAQDVRRNLIAVGAHALHEVIGRTDLLEINERHLDLIKNRKLDLSFALRAPLPYAKVKTAFGEAPLSKLNQDILTDCGQALLNNQDLDQDYWVINTDRAVTASLSGALAGLRHRAHLDKRLEPFTKTLELNFNGSAGQGFGVLLVPGIELRLRGEANDSLGKMMSGGKIVLRPSEKATFNASDNVITGNCALYGATGGTLYVNGKAGDRFAVRNSGALAVVEGTGLHACEYMTNGLVVVLGACSENIGSGMTGGTLYLLGDQSAKINDEFLGAAPLSLEDEMTLLEILKDYVRETESPLASSLINDWPHSRALFQKWLPKNILAKQAVVDASKTESVETEVGEADLVETETFSKQSLQVP